MANHKSAQKRARQSERRRVANRQVKSRVKTAIKSFQTSLTSGDRDAAQTHLRAAEGVLRRAASKGILPARRASRLVSRLARRLGREAQPSS